MSNAETVEQRGQLVQRIWQLLERSWLWATIGGVTLILYLFALVLQQMPGQLQDDPAGAARWTLVTGENFGPLGRVLRAFGLFDVIHNPLLQLLLAILALVVFIQLGNAIAAGWRLYQLPAYLKQAGVRERAPTPTVAPTANESASDNHREDQSQAAAPLALPVTQPLFRLRRAVPVTVYDLTERLQDHLATRFDTVMHEVVPADSDLSASLPTVDQRAEYRLLAVRHLRYGLLRPLFFLGLLLAIVTVWIILNWGWNVMPPPLAPGAEYRAASHQLTLRYEYPSHVAETPAGRDAQPLILAEVGTAQQRAPVGSTIRLQQGQTLITNHAGPPALLIETLSGEPLLSRLGQSQTMPSMGLIFPSPGSEETIVVGQVLGLRVVRLPAQSPDQPEQFLAELYDANSELLERIPIQEQSTAELQIQERTITLAFALLPSMAVEVAHRPGMWLFWPALLLVVLGLIGHRYRPAFVLAQLGNWPEQRSVVIIQSDRADEVTAMAQWLNLAAEVE